MSPKARTELQICVSDAKSYAEFDFEVRFAAAAPKLAQKLEKLIFETEQISEKKFGVSKNEMSGII